MKRVQSSPARAARVRSGSGEAGRDRASPMKAPPVAARVLAVAVVLVLAWHFLATYTWNASPNATRATITQPVLSAYMIPMFGQSWSVFAPNPGSVNQSLDVRAIVTKDGKNSTTQWYSLTERSAAQDVQLHPIPARTYLNDFILANRYYDSFLAIDEKARDRAGDEYLGANWPTKLQKDLLAGLDQSTSPVVNAYIEYERTVLGLASEVALARWGSGVSKVQVRVLKQPVVPFSQRNDNVTTKTSFFIDGWREPVRVPGLNRSVFKAMFTARGN